MTENKLMFKVEKIHTLPAGSRLKAFADVSINDVILVKGCRIVDGKGGLFVSMPQEQGKDKRWYDLVKCLNEDTQKELTDIILDEYNKSLII